MASFPLDALALPAVQAVSSLEMRGCSQGAFGKAAEEGCDRDVGEAFMATSDSVRIDKIFIIEETSLFYHAPASCEMKS